LKKNRPFGCEVCGFRAVLGDHVEQHDIPQVPP
jgi:hypothetical protein